MPRAASAILEMLSQPVVMSERSGPRGCLFPWSRQAVDLLCTQLIRACILRWRRFRMRRRAVGWADWQVKRVTDYMREFLDRDIGLDEMAALVGLSRFHFATAFRQATGASPHHYLTALRMTQARAGKLLSQPDLPIIIQVALKLVPVGYRGTAAASAFHRQLGQGYANNMTPPPREFRQAL